MEAHLQPTNECDEDAEAEADDIPLEVVRQFLGEDRPNAGEDKGGHAEDVTDQITFQLENAVMY